VSDTEIVSNGPIKYIIDDSLRLLSESWILGIHHPLTEHTSLSDINWPNKKALVIRSHFLEASAGILYELNLETGSYVELIPDTVSASKAEYLSSGDIIVYCYGTGTMDPGYYKIDSKTGVTTLFLRHISPAEVNEVNNGFDISSDERFLYIPLVYRDRSPKILRYEIATQTLDTLPVVFDYTEPRNCLWLRLSKDGKRILYSQYPEETFTYTSYSGSEIGIIDLETDEKKVLDIDPFGFSDIKVIGVFPEWSPDEQHIVYGVAQVLTTGAVGSFALYALKYY
jgi:hypothetical protein